MVKKSEILTMTTQEFEDELSRRNWDFVIEKYITLANALYAYKEGAILSNEENYLNVNEYFDILRVQYTCLKFLENYL